MSEMDTVCNQRFDKLPLIIENNQSDSWKERWKSREENMITEEKCSSDNRKSNGTDESGCTVDTSVNITSDETELLETSENALPNNHDAKLTIEKACFESPSNEMEIDIDINEDESHEDIASKIIDSVVEEVAPVSVKSTESSNLEENEQNISENFIKVCEISNCSYFGKPDPLITIEKVDHESSFECYETGSTSKQEGNASIILESDQNAHGEDDIAEALEDVSDIEVEYSKGKSTLKHSHNSTNPRYVHGVKEPRYKSHCKKSDSCDVVQISSSDDDDEEEEEEDEDMEEDDEESVHSHFIHAKDEQSKRTIQPANYICSLITMEVQELNVSAMKAGPISCFPDHGCIFFKDFNNHSSQDATRETIIQAHSLESHHWVPMFGGLVLEVTLNLTGCHEHFMTFFQVPLIKIAGYYLRFPPVVLKIYFEARVVDLTLKHNFQQFLNCSLYGRSASWHSPDKTRQMHPYQRDVYHARHELVHPSRTARRLMTRKRAYPYMLRIVRSSRASTKFSYYKPPMWPYIKKVEHYERKKNSKFKKIDFCSSNFEQHVDMSSGHWSMPPQSSQNYYRVQHNYFNQTHMGSHDFVGSSLGVNSFNPMNLQQNPNIGVMPASHHLQTGHWFDRIQQEQSPVYVTSGFQGTTTKLFTYKPPNSKGGINVTNEDLFCLNDGEYLNDVIIDFYLKYLMEETVSNEDKERTHVFSSFFYGHLISGNANDLSSNLSPEEQRHAKVKTWTRHVDIFSKDFIIVPINESYHWFLAIICFPNVQGITKYRHASLENSSSQILPHPALVKNSVSVPESVPLRATQEPEDSNHNKTSLSVNELKLIQGSDCFSLKGVSLPAEDLDLKSKEEMQGNFTSTIQSDISQGESLVALDTLDFHIEVSGSSTIGVSSEPPSLSYEDQQNNKTEIEREADFKDKEVDMMDDDILMEINSEDAESTPDSPDKLSQDGLTDEITLDHEANNDSIEKADSSTPGHGNINPINPCILIFDSLKGESRYDVVNILRQYLQVEWNQKKKGTEGERVFDKSTMKGSMVTCPQQPNSSDCGIYVLQFVEAFFKDPVKDFTLPLSLVDWFTSRVAMSKRYQLAKLIMKLKDELSPSLDYDPSTDGCFNIAPIVSDDDDNESGEADEKIGNSKEGVTKLDKKEEKLKDESNCEACKDGIARNVPPEEHLKDGVEGCDLSLDNLESTQEAKIFSLDEQKK